MAEKMTQEEIYQKASKLLNDVPENFEKNFNALLPIFVDTDVAAQYVAEFESRTSMRSKINSYGTFDSSAEFIGDVLEKTELPLHIPSELNILEKSREAKKKTPEQMNGPLRKAVPPSMQSYGSISYQPSQYHSGTLVWPGIAPQSLAKIVADNLAPQLIIGQRVDDVLGYSHLSSQPWKPGWMIEPAWRDSRMTRQMSRDIREAEQFLMNGGYGISNTMERLEKRLYDFPTCLAAITRNTLTFDGIAIWTERDAKDRVTAFKPLSSSNIRLVDPDEGYLGDKRVSTVAVDELGNVAHEFSLRDLFWYVRNPRLDPGIYSYGYSEVEIGINMIRGYTNAMGLNLNRFDKNSTPNGILKVTGAWSQRQLDVLNRLWINMKRGQTKNWVLPVMRMPDEGDIEIMELSTVQGWETVYGDFVNMVLGAFCAVYRFPPSRLGYRTSGMQGDNAAGQQTTKDAVVDKNDTGLPALLMHIENVINEGLISSRWAHLHFRFQGKNPKEDARQYEAKLNAMTYGERRRAAALPDLEDTVKDPTLKKVARIMEMTPGDAAYTGVFQSVLQGHGLAGKEGGQGSASSDNIGSIVQSKKDPADAEKHGHASGIRRETDRDKKISGQD